MKTIKMIFCITVLLLSLSNPTQAEDKKESSTTSDETLVLEAGKRPIPGIHIYDANGKHVGLAMDVLQNPIGIYSSKLERIVGIDIRDGTVIYSGTLYFVSDDCTGQMLFGASQSYFVHACGGTYYTGERVASSYTTISSRKKGTNDCECEKIERTDYVVPAIEVTPEELGFDTPIALPLQFKAGIVSLDK